MYFLFIKYHLIVINIVCYSIKCIYYSLGTLGILKITGYLRGTTLSVNQLIHIPGLGDFQMSEIHGPPDPNKVNKIKKNDMETSEQLFIKVLEKADPSKQESLKSENIPDPMDAEQTWPTNEELEMAAKEQKVGYKFTPYKQFESKYNCSTLVDI